MESNKENLQKVINQLETQLSDLKLELENTRFQEQKESEQRQFYQLVADFTFGWELWLSPDGKIKYCSPSCFDLTGYTATQIMASKGITDLLVYEVDKSKYSKYVREALSQSLVNPSLEFRVLTRTKQMRWFIMNARGVYDKNGKYLGIRASVQDITNLKQAMGHISELERTKEFEYRNKQRLQTELDLKDRELVAFLLQLSQKNDLLNTIQNILVDIKKADAKKLRSQLATIKEVLTANAKQPVDWSMIENQVEKVHPGFLERLVIKHPLITTNDKKLASYVRLGLSSKEMAGLLNITYKSVEIARVRLRRKLQISPNIRLAHYLAQI
jgi:PAS domain S-box-containing protein